MGTQKRASGFTIVELAIVIVVMAILATVIIVSWTGVRERADDTQTAEAIKVYKTALEAYVLEHGEYPPTSTSDQKACLGQDYASNRCWQSGSEFVTEDATFMESLQSVHDDVLPMPATTTNVREGAIYEGVRSGYWNEVDGKKVPLLVYSIKGSGPCPVGPVLSRPNQSQLLTFSSERPADGVTRPKTATEPALCYIQLPPAL